VKYLIFLFVPAIAFCACQSNGTGGGQWSAPSTWSGCSGGGVPGPTDDPTIITPDSVTIDTSIVVNSLTVKTTGSLIFDGAAPRSITTASGIHALQGTLDFASHSTFTNTMTFLTSVPLSSSASLIDNTRISPYNQTVRESFAHCIFYPQGGIAISLLTGYNNTLSLSYSQCNGAYHCTNTYYVPQVSISNVTSNGALSDVFYGYSATVTGWNVINVTDINPAGNGALLYGVFSGLNMLGNAVITDTAAVYSRRMSNFSAWIGGESGTTLLKWNLGKYYNTDGGIGGCVANASLHCIIDSNVQDGAYEDYKFRDYNDSKNNIAIANAEDSLGQGAYFSFGSSNITSSNDVAVMDTQDDRGSFGFFFIGNNVVKADHVAVTHATAAMLPIPGTCVAGILFGDGLNVDSYQAVNASVDHSMTTNCVSPAYNGIGIGGQYWQGGTASTYVNTGMGGVGLWRNNIYNSSRPYDGPSGGTFNFDDGVHKHPSATYGDLPGYNPAMYTTVRRWANCDVQLGGPGTTAHIFQMLANRWNNTNGNYTAEAIYSCMRAGFAPTNLQVMTGDGSYTGAVAPIVIGGWARPQ